MSVVDLSDRASAELLDIYLHGIRMFGAHQADRYIDSLESCFALLARNPRMGRRADIVGAGLRRHEHMSHVIFYEEIKNGVFIVAVLHGRQIPDLGGD